MSLLDMYMIFVSMLGSIIFGIATATYILDVFVTFRVFGMRFKLYKELP